MCMPLNKFEMKGWDSDGIPAGGDLSGRRAHRATEDRRVKAEGVLHRGRVPAAQAQTRRPRVAAGQPQLRLQGQGLLQ